MIRYQITNREIFVDHEAAHRSGHMGHAMVEYAPGKILDFYSNVDYYRVDGHSGYGWMEFKRSEDFGKTWSKPEILPYSKRIYDRGINTALCEKAVLCNDGAVLLFFMITDAGKPISCEPWDEPTIIKSYDGGVSWSEGKTFGAAKGRIYDAVNHKGIIYVLSQANDAQVTFLGNKPEHVYMLYISEDNGENFYTAGKLPIDAMGKGYGALEFTAGDKLMAYVYNGREETSLVYCVSNDFGKSWSNPLSSYCAKKIRNPQVVRMHDCWFLHGRTGGSGGELVLYASGDGIHWDEGCILDRRPGPGVAYYSNNLPVSRFAPQGPDRLLIQYSHVYDKNRVNIMHIWIENITQIPD